MQSVNNAITNGTALDALTAAVPATDEEPALSPANLSGAAPAYDASGRLARTAQDLLLQAVDTALAKFKPSSPSGPSLPAASK